MQRAVVVGARALGCALAVCLWLLGSLGEASASQQHPHIVAASSTVTRSQQAYVISRGAAHVPCAISLSSHGRVVSKSRARRPGSSGTLEFVWSFPQRTRARAWIARVRCHGSSRSAGARIELVGSRSGRAAGARRIAIRAIAVSSRRLPSLIEPPARGAKGGGAYPKFGTLILAAGDWLGGHGVNVYSDGAPGADGLYQCVELFERLINARGWYHGIAGAGIHGANQLFGAVPSSAFDKHSNGSGYIPVPGDAVIFAGGEFGHVAIVDFVAAGHVGLVEQNASASGRTTISISGSTLGKDGPSLSVIGVLHAKANTAQSAPAQPAPAGTGSVFPVANTSESAPDGVYFRNSPHTADTSRTPGVGVFMGEQVRLICFAFGDAVGPYDDSLWYDVANVTRPTSNGTANVGWLNAHYIADGRAANQVDAGVPACAGYSPAPPPAPGQPAPAPPPPPTYAETSGGVVHTWTNYSNAGGTQGPSIPSNATVQIACKLTGFTVADGNTWWYRIASSPWNGGFYASADAFYNNGQTSGSLHGTPYVDGNVPNC